MKQYAAGKLELSCWQLTRNHNSISCLGDGGAKTAAKTVEWVLCLGWRLRGVRNPSLHWCSLQGNTELCCSVTPFCIFKNLAKQVQNSSKSSAKCHCHWTHLQTHFAFLKLATRLGMERKACDRSAKQSVHHFAMSRSHSQDLSPTWWFWHKTSFIAFYCKKSREHAGYCIA